MLLNYNLFKFINNRPYIPLWTVRGERVNLNHSLCCLPVVVLLIVAMGVGGGQKNLLNRTINNQCSRAIIEDPTCHTLSVCVCLFVCYTATPPPPPPPSLSPWYTPVVDWALEIKSLSESLLWSTAVVHVHRIILIL